MKCNDKISIVGLGYVGLPLAYLTAINGFDVVGIDNNINVVNSINKRTNIPKEIENGYNEKNISLHATNKYESIKGSKIIIICVPTPTEKNIPDLKTLQEVIENISKFITKDALIIIESTLAPGMTRKYVEQYLRINHNLKIDIDYDLAYCPERIDPGNEQYWVGNINRVCGASSQKALERVCSFYRKNIDAKIIPMGSIEEAEMVKVWENSMRNISIAEANLLALLCDKNNFSVKRLIEGLNSKVEQFGLNIALPGIGPGGHCIPEDIHYLIQSMENYSDMQLFKQSVKINEYMPQYACEKLISSVGDFKNMNVLMLGKAYKPNSVDIRKSQAIVLYELIKKRTHNIHMIDPIVNPNDNKFLINLVNKADIIIISCPHNIFLSIDFLKCKNLKYIFDCCNKLNKNMFDNTNIKYIGIGE